MKFAHLIHKILSLLQGFKVTIISIALIGLMTAYSAVASNITIACSANFVMTLTQIIKAYKKIDSSAKITIISGSSGKLTTQLSKGLPADIFLSADTMYPKYLYKHKMASKPFNYATGKLVLVINKPIKITGTKTRMGIKFLKTEKLLHFTIANPNLAPYGLHAEKILKDLGLWKKYQSKLVYGENISQTFNYVISKNADAGFVALSQVIQYNKQSNNALSGHVYNIFNNDAKVSQQGVVLNRAQNKPSVIAFKKFLLHSVTSKKIIQKMGYQIG